MRQFSGMLYSYCCRGLGSTSSTLLSRIPGAVHLSGGAYRHITSGEAFAALKPFFFAVHPDLFGQHPRERAINEDSLKQLNSFIESSAQSQGFFRPSLKSTQLTFYLRNGVNAIQQPSTSSAETFQAVKIVIGNNDIRKTIHSILETCKLSTSYLDSLPQTSPQHQNHRAQQGFGTPEHYAQNDYDWHNSQDVQDVEDELDEAMDAQQSLRTWLEDNVENARKRILESWPVREEIVRLKQIISDTMGVSDVVWDCGWGTRHCRGCLVAFLALAKHHPDNMEILRGKTLIFGRDTGVNLDGHLILSSGEVRANWLDAIKRANRHNHVISRIPRVEKTLSRTLKDIKVVHRKFEPEKMATSYESNLRKLITSIGDYKGRSNFPSHWPSSLSHLELVVESDSGPLMVSPTGQFIVPSSCPPFLLVNFITEKMEEALEKLGQYKREKYEERDLHIKCMDELGLFALEKADNITPNLMIECLSRLLSNTKEFRPVLEGTHLWITTYYSVHSDGEISIPWNWK